MTGNGETGLVVSGASFALERGGGAGAEILI